MDYREQMNILALTFVEDAESLNAMSPDAVPIEFWRWLVARGAGAQLFAVLEDPFDQSFGVDAGVACDQGRDGLDVVERGARPDQLSSHRSSRCLASALR